MSEYSIPNWAELVPVQGRDYASAAKAKASFLEGRDWGYAAAGYASTSLREGYIKPGTSIVLRYKALTMVTTVKVTQAMIDKALDTPLDVLSKRDANAIANTALPAYNSLMRSMFS